jgi:hypothetical protein
MLAIFAFATQTRTGGPRVGGLLGISGPALADGGSGSGTDSSTTTSTTACVPSGSSSACPSTTTTSSTTSTTIAGSTTSTTAGSTTTTTACQPQLSVTLQAVAPGGTTGLNGACLPANQVFDVVLHSDPVSLGTVHSGADGTFAVTIVIPADTPPGSHSIHATGAGVDPSISLLVTSPTPIPVTGIRNADWAWLGMAMILAGVILLAGKRVGDSPLF